MMDTTITIPAPPTEVIVATVLIAIPIFVFVNKAILKTGLTVILSILISPYHFGRLMLFLGKHCCRGIQVRFFDMLHVSALIGGICGAILVVEKIRETYGSAEPVYTRIYINGGIVLAFILLLMSVTHTKEEREYYLYRNRNKPGRTKDKEATDWEAIARKYIMIYVDIHDKMGVDSGFVGADCSTPEEWKELAIRYASYCHSHGRIIDEPVLRESLYGALAG